MQFNEPDVNRLREKISYRQFVEWQVFYRNKPFGDVRADLRQAMTSCLFANANRVKNQAPFKIDDFMISRPQKKKQSVKEMAMLLETIFSRRK